MDCSARCEPGDLSPDRGVLWELTLPRVAFLPELKLGARPLPILDNELPITSTSIVFPVRKLLPHPPTPPSLHALRERELPRKAQDASRKPFLALVGGSPSTPPRLQALCGSSVGNAIVRAPTTSGLFIGPVVLTDSSALVRRPGRPVGPPVGPCRPGRLLRTGSGWACSAGAARDACGAGSS